MKKLFPAPLTFFLPAYVSMDSGVAAVDEWVRITLSIGTSAQELFLDGVSVATASARSCCREKKIVEIFLLVFSFLVTTLRLLHRRLRCVSVQDRKLQVALKTSLKALSTT